MTSKNTSGLRYKGFAFEAARRGEGPAPSRGASLPII